LRSEKSAAIVTDQNHKEGSPKLGGDEANVVVAVAAEVERQRRPGPRLVGLKGGPAQARRRSASASRENVHTLLREYREEGNMRSRERLIQQYMPLVKSLARRHSMRGELYEDLVQVGCIGLIKAVDRYDPQRRVEFGAFAIPNVAGEIKRYLRDRGWPIRIPRRLQELRPGLCACSAELAVRLERPATVHEIAESTGVAEPEVAAALDTERIQSPVSLSQPGTDEDDSLYADLEVQDGGYELGEARALLAAGFRILTTRERRLLALQFFGGLSQPQVAREVGISQIHVSRLTRRALAKLRAEIGPLQDNGVTAASGRR
jgi:RNA polymerase sigma-B factor